MRNLNLTHWLMLALFIVSLILFRQCGQTDSAIARAETAENNVQIDTVETITPGRIDTIHDTVPKWYPKLVPYYAGDTTNTDGDTLSIFKTAIEDSLIVGEFTSTVRGTLIHSDFKYVKKSPVLLFQRDTLLRKTEIKETIVKDPLEFYIGGVVGGNSARFNLQPALLMRIPKKSMVIGYGFDVIDKTHNVHLFTKIKWGQ